MENSEKHSKLPEALMRDFLGKSIKDCGYPRKKETIENEIKKLSNELEKAKISEGIFSIIKLKGWYELDVSDEITDYNPETYFNFIGTKEEHKNLNVR